MRLARETNIRTWPSFRASADAAGVAVNKENAQLRVITDELSHRIKNVVGIIHGKVAVHWELAGSGGQRRFIMTWRESGGPRVTERKHWDLVDGSSSR